VAVRTARGARERLGVRAHALAHPGAAESRAEQQLQRAERARREHHLVGAERAGPRLGLPPAAQARHLVLGEDLRAELLRAAEVRAVQGVLRAVAAAHHAAAAEDAGV